ncbi:MAG: hypothetical protein JO053_04270 [Acidobacteria bacterium]|nr:hypothetical protein [Acidobacteriota bacterium]
MKEIENVSPLSGEDEKLQAERKLLANAEKIFELSGKSFGVLYENDENVLSMLAQVRRHLEELAGLDVQAAQYLDDLQAAIASLRDLAEGIRAYLSSLDFSPRRLADIEQRLAQLERLKRKYSSDLDEILQVKAELAGRLSKLEDLAHAERTLKEALGVLDREYTRLAETLSESRGKAAPVLAEKVMEELGRLAMEQAKFLVSLETAERSSTDWQNEPSVPDASDNVGVGFFTSTGADRVEFLLSANQGEEARPLSRAVSGGELSRLMLTLRLVGLRVGRREAQATNETFIFDEIDAGIGGRVAEVVGQRLKALSAVRQVLCVTHQPQIASFADHHYRVEKFIEEGRTITSIEELRADERVEEIARMIGGSQRTEKTLEVARWLIDNAGNHRSEAGRQGGRQKGFKKALS